MLQLIVETKDQALKSQIKKAYTKALESTSFESFVTSLNSYTDENTMVGVSGSHVWISDKETGKRHAIIII